MIISSVPKLLTGLSSPGDPSWSNIDRGNPLGGIMPMIIDFPDLLPFIFLEYFSSRSSRFLLLWFLPWVLLPRRDSCMGKWTFINQENIFGEKRFFRKKNFGIDPILQCWLKIYFDSAPSKGINFTALKTFQCLPSRKENGMWVGFAIWTSFPRKKIKHCMKEMATLIFPLWSKGMISCGFWPPKPIENL